MQLGNFIWPNDPQSLRVVFDRKVEMQPTEDGFWRVENLGRYSRTFEGEGVFYGEGAYQHLRTLANFLYGGVVQELTHPQWDKANVLVTHLEVTEECQNNYLRYRFTFVEVPV